MKGWRATWCRRWARRPSGPITPRTSAASRSAARPRTCWRSPPGSSSAGKLGASALAALTTRGFSELARLGRACGARSETLAGLSGLGDLILSCSSLQSRNFAFGIALGRGEAPNRDKLAEGEFTAPVLIELAASQNVDMPVSNAVAAILSGKVTIDAAIEGLLTRPFKAEE